MAGLDEFDIPKRTARDADGHDVVTFDLSGLRRLKGGSKVRTPQASAGTTYRAFVNTAWSDTRGASSWVNGQEPGQYLRRVYESRETKGPMVRALASVRSLAVRRALRIARFWGYTTLVITHES